VSRKPGIYFVEPGIYFQEPGNNREPVRGHHKDSPSNESRPWPTGPSQAASAVRGAAAFPRSR
jgi:hypothetical protein